MRRHSAYADYGHTIYILCIHVNYFYSLWNICTKTCSVLFRKDDMIAMGISWENFSRSGTRECIPYSLWTIFFFYIMTNKISMFYGFPQLFMLPSKQIIYNSNYIKLQLFKYCSTICCSGRVRAPIFLLLFTTSKLAIFR